MSSCGLMGLSALSVEASGDGSRVLLADDAVRSIPRYNAPPQRLGLQLTFGLQTLSGPHRHDDVNDLLGRSARIALVRRQRRVLRLRKNAVLAIRRQLRELILQRHPAVLGVMHRGEDDHT